MVRYLAATAMGRKLYPEGLGAQNDWIPARLVYYPENVAGIMAAPYPHDGLVTDAEELRRIVRETTLPAVRVWIPEDLEGVACEIWEKATRQSANRGGGGMGSEEQSSSILLRIGEKPIGDTVPDRTYSLHAYLTNNGSRTFRHYRLEIFLPKFLNPTATEVEDLGQHYEDRTPFLGFALTSRGESSYIFPGQTRQLLGEPSRFSGLPETGRPLIRYVFGKGQESAIRDYALTSILYSDDMGPQRDSVKIVDIENLGDR